MSVTDALRYKPKPGDEHIYEKPSGRVPPEEAGPLAPLTIVSQPHQHCWQAVGIVELHDDPVLDSLRGVHQAVAQSCECGEVRAVLLRLAPE